MSADPVAINNDPRTDQPVVSIIIACRNVGGFIDDALWSARRQSLRDIEILIVDDGSTDDTRQRVTKHAAEDRRLRLFDGPGRGPAAARNIALRAARGAWISVLDGDDMIHPRRLELMLSAEIAATSDILAENQILFYEDGSAAHYLREGAGWQRGQQIDLPLYISANTMFGKGPALGYLKPLIRRSRLTDSATFYDETLRIGEDYDLVVRLMRDGAMFSFRPAAFYSYRRHSASISFRLSASDLAALISAADSFQASLPAALVAARQAAAMRRVGLLRASRFVALVNRLKARDLIGAARDLVSHPSLLSLLVKAVWEGGQRRLRRARPANDTISAKHGTRKVCGLFWQGDPAGAASALAWLAQNGWQIRLIPGPQTAEAIEALQHIAILPSLAEARNCDVILIEDHRLIDYIPFLLSPDSIIGLIATNDRPAPASGGLPAIRYMRLDQPADEHFDRRLRDLGLPPDRQPMMATARLSPGGTPA